MANRKNVGQHVVPRCYLKHFGDTAGIIHVQDKNDGRIFSTGTETLCKENEIYTLLLSGKRDYSYDSINNDIESALGPVLTELRAGVNLRQEGVRSRVFTHLALFTANLIARSRILRNHFKGSLDTINTFLTAHPDFLNDFPDREYQRFLINPQSDPKLLKWLGAQAKYLELLREYNQSITAAPPGVDDTIASLITLAQVQYPALLKSRTGATVELLVEVGAKADLLVTETHRFISNDDPVLFLVDGRREVRVVPTHSRHWTEAGRSVYLPLNPNCAVLWKASGSYSSRIVSAAEVQAFNALVKEGSLRHILASDPADFSRVDATLAAEVTEL